MEPLITYDKRLKEIKKLYKKKKNNINDSRIDIIKIYDKIEDNKNENKDDD